MNGHETQGKQKLSYWVENQRKLYHQFLRDDHTPLTPERKSAFENIGFFWTNEKGSAVKGTTRKKNTRLIKKGNMRVSIVN